MPISLNFIIILQSPAAPTFQKIGRVLRLSFEGVEALNLRAEKSPAQGGGCKGVPTEDLVLTFAKSPQWVNSFDPQTLSLGDNIGPCEIQGRPLQGGEKFELRLSYKAEKGRDIEAVTYSSAAATYVDHWFSFERKGGKSARSKGKGAPLQRTQGFGEFFENSISWQRVAGNSKDSSDINSPGLDKFRDYPHEANVGILAEPVERLPLKLPLLDLPLASFKIEFEEKKLPLEKFTAEDLAEFKNLSENRRKLVLDSLNLIVNFVEKKEWARAFDAINILEKSNLKNFVPKGRASWWTLKGYVALKYSDTPFPTGDKDAPGLLLQKGLEDWREGIRLFSGLGGLNQEYAEYMVVELVRNLFQRQLPFAALSAMIWAQKYSWSAMTEERFEYLKAVALENLALFQEAEKAFRAFFAGRSSLSASVIHDRRLVPAAALWPGDMELKERNYRAAIEKYTEALNKVPSPRKFSFEKSWYPDMVRQFPEVLLNRAEAYMRTGQFSNALKDLRAFIFVAPNHTFASIAYYRVGDILEQLEADPAKAQGAFRECIFRFRDQAAGPLCQARIAYHQMLASESERTEWPRLIASIEDAQQSLDVLPKFSFQPDDVRVYLGILLADVFLKTDQPLQALMRLDPLDKIKPTDYMGLWLREYRITSLQGVLKKRLQEGNPRDVISEYEKRQKTLFLYQTRGEVLLSLSQAFAALGLWEDALKSFEQATRVKAVIKRPVNRRYDPGEEEWKIQEAHVYAHLFAGGKKSDAETLKVLRQAPETSELVLRAWILYAQTKKDDKVALVWWKKLENIASLKSDDIRDYAKALENTRQTKELRELLERRLGVALTESSDSKVDKNLSTELFMKLAELRRSSKEYDRALTVLNFLLTLAPKNLHVRTPRVLILYQKGLVLKDLKRLEEALAVFREAELAAPDAIWGKLSKSNAVEIEAGLKRQSENR